MKPLTYSFGFCGVLLTVIVVGQSLLWSHLTPRAEPLVTEHMRASDDAPLTVEETIGAVFKEDAQWHLYCRANPAAKEELYQVLRMGGDDMYHHQFVFLILGYIGDGKDAGKLRDILKGSSGVLSRRGEFGAMISAFMSLGLMSRRGIPEATEILDEMLSIEYWRGTFKWLPDKVTTNPLPAELESVARVVRGCAIAGREDLREVRERILNGVADEKVRRYLAGMINVGEMWEEAQGIRVKEQQISTTDERAFLRRLYQDRENHFAGLREWHARQSHGHE